VNRFRFDSQLGLSRGVTVGAAGNVAALLRGSVPAAVAVRPAVSAADRCGTDFWVDTRAGGTLSVDVKIMSRDRAHLRGGDNLILETWSVCERRVPGWTWDPDKRTDYICWIWRDTGRWCLVPFPLLFAVFRTNARAWVAAYPVRRQFTERTRGPGYTSECVLVPRAVVWAEIYRRFGGCPQNQNTNSK
jgi:hypothetical protein